MVESAAQPAAQNCPIYSVSLLDDSKTLLQIIGTLKADITGDMYNK